ncbi:hypothetical protein ACIBBG_32150 [Micromonospora chersina]|uniref:hypothetical protein n=1 Tax=Micromonospora chersina TaxID=47854 RepID=UPI003799DF5C
MTNVQTPAGVAQPAPAPQPKPTSEDPLPSRIGPKAAPAAQVSATAAGQPALIRIARTNMLRAISRECFAADRDALPAPVEVAFSQADPQNVTLIFDSGAEVIAWAERHGAGAAVRESHHEATNGTRWRLFAGTATWRGFALALAATEQSTAAAA